MYRPKGSFYLQWHITQACNLRCKHCYQPDYANNNEFTFVELAQAFIQYKELIDFFNKDVQTDDDIIAPILSFTGGEPFLREDFLDLLEIVSANIPTIAVCILSNGTLITLEIAKKLANLKIERVQISLDGDEEIHDSIRGRGAFKKALNGIKNLTENGIEVSVSFTAHKQNYKLFKKVVKIAKENKARMVWTDRLIPQGSGAELLLMDENETKDYVQMIADCKCAEETCAGPFKVGAHRALQFIGVHNDIYKCSAGKSGLCLMHNGDVYPCRRLPIKAGNIREKSLKEIFFENEILNSLRTSRMPKDCENCRYNQGCAGGLKCLSFAVFGNTSSKDPGCWLKSND